jgi:hypothetical protein
MRRIFQIQITKLRAEDITIRALLYKVRDFYPLFNSGDFLTGFASASFKQVRVARSEVLICGCLKGADGSCEYIAWNDRMRIAVCCHLMPCSLMHRYQEFRKKLLLLFPAPKFCYQEFFSHYSVIK